MDFSDDVGYTDDESIDFSSYSSNDTNTSDFSDWEFDFSDWEFDFSDWESDFSNWESDLCEAGKHKFTIKTFQICVFCLIFLLGMVGNCLVIATFTLYRRLRLRSMTDIFLFHLALADLLLLLTLPLQAVDTLSESSSGALYRATRACYSVNTYSGLLLLACISVDRYMVVARAQQTVRLRSRILTAGKSAAVCVWLVAVLLSLLGVLSYEYESEAYCGIIKCERVKMATNGATVTIFCLSLAVMVVCYSLIARALWEGNALRRGKQWQRQRTLKLMVALVLVFLAFQLPYTVVLLLKMAGPFCNLLLEYVTCTLAYARCCLNPILYALVGVRFRNDVLRLVHDSGCRCGLQLAPQCVSTNSISFSIISPASVLLAGSPTSPGHGYSSNEAGPPITFQFPRTK